MTAIPAALTSDCRGSACGGAGGRESCSLNCVADAVGAAVADVAPFGTPRPASLAGPGARPPVAGRTATRVESRLEALRFATDTDGSGAESARSENVDNC